MSDHHPQNVLQEINQSIACNEQENAKLPIIENLKTRIEKELKKDGLFELLFKKFHNTGSVCDQLQCCGRDYDFDINVILSIVEIEPKLRFFLRKDAPGFTQLQLTTDQLRSQKTKWNLNWDDFLYNLTSQDPKSGRLWIDPTFLRKWFQTIVKNVDVKYLTDNNVRDIKMEASGPGLRLKITAESLSDPIQVDLVPVLEFLPYNLFANCGVFMNLSILIPFAAKNEHPWIKKFFLWLQMLRENFDITNDDNNKWENFVKKTESSRMKSPIFAKLLKFIARKFEVWLETHREFYIIFEVLYRNNVFKEPFFLVPKPCCHDNVEDADIKWRLDFQMAEIKILEGCPKNTIRLLKTFRSGNAKEMGGKNKHMSGLSSYLLKTIVMLLVRDKPGVNFTNKLAKEQSRKG